MLKDDILQAFPDLTAKTRDDVAIAKRMSVGRTKVAVLLGGMSNVIQALGVDGGVAFLAACATAEVTSADHWILEILKDVRADLGAPGFTALMAKSKALTDVQRAAWMALVTVPDPISDQDVAIALAGVLDVPPDPNAPPDVIPEAEAASAGP